MESNGIILFHYSLHLVAECRIASVPMHSGVTVEEEEPRKWIFSYFSTDLVSTGGSRTKP